MMPIERYSCYVSAASILFFSPAVSASEKEDVLNSNVYLQLAASTKYPDFAAREQWQQTYALLLHSLEWLVVQQQESESQVPQHTGVTLTGLIASAYASCVGEQSSRDLVLALERLARLPAEHPAISLLRSHSIQQGTMGAVGQSDQVRIHLAVVEAGIRLTSVMISLTSRAIGDDNFLGHIFTADSVPESVSVNTRIAVLDELDYEVVRQRVISSLGALRSKNTIEVM